MPSPENGHSCTSVWILPLSEFIYKCCGGADFWKDRTDDLKIITFKRQNGHHEVETVFERKGGFYLCQGKKRVGEICQIVTDTGAMVVQVSTLNNCPDLVKQLEKTGWTRIF